MSRDVVDPGDPCPPRFIAPDPSHPNLAGLSSFSSSRTKRGIPTILNYVGKTTATICFPITVNPCDQCPSAVWFLLFRSRRCRAMSSISAIPLCPPGFIPIHPNQSRPHPFPSRCDQLTDLKASRCTVWLIAICQLPFAIFSKNFSLRPWGLLHYA
jgi:hypothetical protein